MKEQKKRVTQCPKTDYGGIVASTIALIVTKPVAETAPLLEENVNITISESNGQL